MSWFLKTDKTDSNSYMLQYSCAILFVKRIYYCCKSRCFFCKYTRSSSQKIDATPLHDNDRHLEYKAAIP